MAAQATQAAQTEGGMKGTLERRRQQRRKKKRRPGNSVAGIQAAEKPAKKPESIALPGHVMVKKGYDPPKPKWDKEYVPW
jgi:hypothetical protein